MSAEVPPRSGEPDATEPPVRRAERRGRFPREGRQRRSAVGRELQACPRTPSAARLSTVPPRRAGRRARRRDPGWRPAPGGGCGNGMEKGRAEGPRSWRAKAAPAQP